MGGGSRMNGPDRRPWLILSMTEAEALRDAALASVDGLEPEVVPPALLRAFRVIDQQLGFIRDGYGEEPTIRAAMQRQP